MKLMLIACAIALTFMACGNSSSSKKRVPTAEEQIIEKQTEPMAVLLDDNTARLAAIRRIIDSIGVVQLPYRLEFDQPTNHTLPYTDVMLVGQHLLYGILPDTSMFYGFLYGIAADVMSVQLSTFDKSGRLIADGEDLLEYNCLHMVEEDIYCDEYIIIQKDLSLHYVYRTQYVLVDHAYDGQCDTISEHFEKKGKINANGTVVFGEEVIYD